MNSLSTRLAEHVRACFTGLWIQSYEHDDAVAEIARLCHAQKWPLAVWDIDQGLRLPAGQPRPGAGSRACRVRQGDGQVLPGRPHTRARPTVDGVLAPAISRGN